MARCQYVFNNGTLASGKTRMAPKPSITTTALWLASNLTDMPLFMKCQINNQKSRASPAQTWIALGKLVATYNFAASPILHCMISTRVAVPQLRFLHSCPCCGDLWSQMGPITSTAWKNTCGTLAVQLQQWHPCQWQD